MSTHPEQHQTKQFPQDIGVALRMIGGGGGLNVSLGDYLACIAACSKLVNPDERLVCMEGCRNIDSKVISNASITEVAENFSKATDQGSAEG